MRYCEETADPAKHVGPFKRLYRVEHPAHPLDAEQCLACGSTVVRKVQLKKESKKRRTKKA
jgi:hypothetical protein